MRVRVLLSYLWERPAPPRRAPRRLLDTEHTALARTPVTPCSLPRGPTVQWMGKQRDELPFRGRQVLMMMLMVIVIRDTCLHPPTCHSAQLIPADGWRCVRTLIIVTCYSYQYDEVFFKSNFCGISASQSGWGGSDSNGLFVL